MTKTNKTPTQKKLLVLSLGYWFSARSLGLLIHPYQSLRQIQRDKVYLPLVWLPSVCLALWWLLGLFISRYNILATLGLEFLAIGYEKHGPMQVLLSFFFGWGVIFFLVWQVVLRYLFWRFRKGK